MRAFIVCPFGTRDGIDFDAVERDLIDPALDGFEITGRTTRENFESGRIHADMFEALLLADVVVADISLDNPNVYYELGIRHALRRRVTILIRTERPENPGRVPFDLAGYRYLSYDHASPAQALGALRRTIRESLSATETDSPVFDALPALREHSRSSFVPQGFREAVGHAAATRDHAMLILLGMEANGFPWESEGLRMAGRAQMNARLYRVAHQTWERVRALEENDAEAGNALGNILHRLGDLAASNQSLQRVLGSPASTAAERAEAFAQIARNKKHEWRALTRGNPADALRSNLLDESRAGYREAFEEDLNAYYPGLNALAMTAIQCELAAAYPGVWEERFETAEEANLELGRLNRERDQLASAVRLSISARKKRRQPGDGEVWLRISEADLILLTSKRPAQVENAFRDALPRDTPDFALDSVRKQLSMYKELGILEANVQAALKVVSLESGAPAGPAPGRVLLFAGHRIDSPGRRKPRFPPDREALARAEIRRAVQAEKEATAGPLLGVAGAADGGDILFLETCLELGIPVRVALALPPDSFLNESVRPDWTARFRALLANPTEVLSRTKELPQWVSSKAGYDFWERNNLWLISHALSHESPVTLIALWDGDKGDGAGGTQHMVDVATSFGARFVHLNTKELFGLD